MAVSVLSGCASDGKPPLELEPVPVLSEWVVFGSC